MATRQAAPTAEPRPATSRQERAARRDQPRASRPPSAPIGQAARALARSAAPHEDRQERPHLTLVTPEHAPQQPQLARSVAAERLAAQTGGNLEQGEGGLSTVHFPPPAQPGLSTHEPYTISRALTEDAPAPAPATTQSSPADNGAAPGGGEKGEQMDPETLYEYFLDRFKRDLLVEREQLGHLIIDNP